MNMNPLIEAQQFLTRRHFLGTTGLGMGSLALGQLLGSTPLKAGPTSALIAPHVKPRASRIIYIHRPALPGLDL
jgi:hypothetical protein